MPKNLSDDLCLFLATEFAVVEIIKCFIGCLALDALFFIGQLAEGFAGFDVFSQLGFVAFVFVPCSAAVEIFFAGRMQLAFFSLGLSVVGFMVFVGHCIGRLDCKTQYQRSRQGGKKTFFQ